MQNLRIPAVVFGFIGMRISGRAIWRLTHLPTEKMFWWYAHLQGMIGSYIAAWTAFCLVTIGPLVHGAWWLRSVPVLIGLPAIIITTAYYQRKFAPKPKTAFPERLIVLARRAARITLVSANARISLAALVASTVGVGVAAGVSFLAGGGTAGATWVLRVGTLAYLAAIALGIRLPTRVDQRDPQPPDPGAGAPEPAPAGAAAPGPVPGPAPGPGAGPEAAPGAGPGAGPAPRPATAGARPRRASWATTLRSVGPIVGEAMRGNAALRAFSGYMIFFLAFLLRTVHFPGTSDKLALGAMIAAAGAGGFIGTGVGALLKARAPHLILFVLLCASTAITAACAAFFGLWAALIVALVAAFSQVLAKLALDSIVQREIPEEIRSSTLAASETIHQLAWVAGGLAGLAMSITDSGVAGLAVAAAGLAATAVLLVASRRRRIFAARAAAARVQRRPG